MSSVIPLQDARVRLGLPRPSAVGAPSWTRRELSGRLTELSGQGAHAMLTLGIELVLDAQRDGEPTAWVMVGEDGFFAPDVARAGVDLEALAVVRAPDAQHAARAAGRLAHSGAFGLIVIDLSGATGGRRGRRPDDRGRPALPAQLRGNTVPAEVPTALMSRLVGLAQRHDTAVVFLTAKPSSRPSLDPLVSLRVQCQRSRDQPGQTHFDCRAEVVKDKRRGPGWTHRVPCHGPPGLW